MINITDHAVVRYAQRFHNVDTINEDYIKIWINQNDDLYLKYKEELLKLWQNKDKIFLVEGVFEKSKKNRNKYYISHDYSVIFITDTIDTTIITVYIVNYNMRNEHNTEIIKIFIKEISMTLEDQKDFLNRKSILYKEIDEKRSVLKGEKSYLESRLRAIELEERSLNVESEKIANTEKEYENKVEYLYRKIIGQHV